MTKFLLIGFLLFSTNVYSQKNLTITVNDLSSKKADNIYITGAFNNWNPGNETYRLKKNDTGRWEIVLKNIPEGTFNYKFTQGTWETEEVTAAGQNVDNHNLIIEKDYTLDISIYG